ncbi:MAG: glycogen-binding domain-containing protein [Chitinophagales bacterium]
MNKRFNIAILSLLCFLHAMVYGQISSDIVHTDNGMLIITIEKKDPAFEDLLRAFNINADSLFQMHTLPSNLSKEGWVIVQIDNKKALIGHPMVDKNSDPVYWGAQPILMDKQPGMAGSPGYPGMVTFGTNDFDGEPTVYQKETGTSVFVIHGWTNAKQIFLSGNFNDWGTSATPMQRTADGWIAELKLEPGKYFYKYIVDGKWMFDPGNKQKESDGYGSYNSTYFVCNYTFHLRGFSDAKNVVLAGDFDGWDPKALHMERSATGWDLHVYLREGTYAYKYVVDKNWILDPDNPLVRPDGSGNANNYISIGDPTNFTLRGYTNAHVVVLSGSFNGWNGAALEMQKTENGWTLPYVLAAGNYEYKFIVDGNWITDPANPYHVGQADQPNSVISVDPNHKFILHGFADAQDVEISGNFNLWADPGYTMQKTADGWEIPLHLEPGKYTYKFIVDGKWILDPGNDLMEENEFGTGNSVFWMEQ